MIHQNILIFFRSVGKNRKDFLINLLGLSFGITCLFMSFFYIQDQLSVDQFHKNKDRLFQIVEHDFNGEYNFSLTTPFPLAESAKEMFPEIEDVEVATVITQTLISFKEKDIHLNGNLKYAGKSFFDFFSFEILEGNRHAILGDKNSVAISRDFAMKLFNSQNVVGKNIEIAKLGAFKISGVYDFPENSSNKKISFKNFDLVLPIENFINKDKGYKKNWVSSNFETFFLMKEGTDIVGFNDKLSEFYKYRLNTDEAQRVKLTLALYSSLYLNDKFENGVQVEGGGAMVNKLIILISFFILLMVCFNFVNMYIAKAMGRIKEIGIKKALGSGRKVLIAQFFTETFLLVSISLVISIILSLVLIPAFSALLDTSITISFDWRLLVYILAIMLLVLILAGGYPALYLSSYNTIKALRGTSEGSVLDVIVRKGIVFFQFFVSIILIVLTVFQFRQVNYMQNKELGHAKENIIIIESNGKLDDQKEVYLSELSQLNGVVKTTSMRGGFYDWNFSDDIKWQNQAIDDKRIFNIRKINTDFFSTMDIKMKTGRVFNKSDRPSTKAILNETAVSVMNLQNPVGEYIEYEGKELEIVGVSSDFHTEPVFYKIKPVVMVYTEQDDAGTILVKINGDKEKVLSSIESFTRNFNPEYPFNYEFFDDYFQIDFKFAKSMINFVSILSIISIIIACLGVFGLVSFMIEKRKKELGIRKALGANDLEIFKQVSLNFLKMMMISFLIGIPLSYLLVRSTLEGVAYKVSLNPIYFVLSMILIIVVTIITLSFHSSKLTRIDPTVCLREE